MVELDSEGELTRSEVASFLHEFADELENGHADERVAHHEELIEEVDEREDERVGVEDERNSRFDADEDRGRQEFAEGEDTGRATESSEAVDPKRVTLIVGGDSATVSVPRTMEFDVEVESRSPMLGSGVSQGIEFDLSWKIENPENLDEEWLEVE